MCQDAQCICMLCDAWFGLCLWLFCRTVDWSCLLIVLLLSAGDAHTLCRPAVCTAYQEAFDETLETMLYDDVHMYTIILV